MPTQLSDMSVRVNSQIVGIDPDSLQFDTGHGTQSVRNVSYGEQALQVYSNDLTSRIGMVSFSIPVTPANIELVTEWKENKNANSVSVTGRADGATTTRTFNRAAYTGPIGITIGTEGSIGVAFEGNQAI